MVSKKARFFLGGPGLIASSVVRRTAPRHSAFTVGPVATTSPERLA
jgi:hypothetical protein